MEEIQFLNYIFSLLAVMLAAAALRIVLKHQDHHDRELKDIRDKIRYIAETAQQKKR